MSRHICLLIIFADQVFIDPAFGIFVCGPLRSFVVNVCTHKELITLNILKYKYCVNMSRATSRDQFGKNCKLLTNWWPV